MSSYVSIVGLNNYFGSDIFKVGQILVLRKDYENNYDDEAIQVEIENVGKVGYIANSTHTVVRGCKSAGKIIEEEEEICQVLIRVLKKSSGQWQTN